MPAISAGRVRETVITRADRALAAGQVGLALGLYRQALARNPRNPPIWIQCGHVLKEAGRLQEAEAAYRQALSYEPQVAELHLHLGHALKLQGRREDAQDAYVRALALDPSAPEPIHELAGIGWSDEQLAELTGMLRPGLPEPPLPDAAAVLELADQWDGDSGGGLTDMPAVQLPGGPSRVVPTP
jgi:Flp pilus assembly protein TadD